MHPSTKHGGHSLSKLVRYAPPKPPSRIDRLRGLADAVRAYWQGPISSSDPALARFFNSNGAITGSTVNEENALSYSAVWAAVSIISSQIGSLPLCLYRNLPTGGKEKFEGHPLYRILHDRPNPEMSSMVFRETLQGHVLTWGNAYAEIQRDGGNRVKALWPLTPDRVTPMRDRAGTLMYKVTQPNGGETYLSADDTLHLPGLGFNGICGYGVIDKMRESIGLGMAAEQFGASFFGNGTTFGGVFKHPGKLTDQARKNFVEAVNARHQGVDRSHKFMLVEEGMDYTRFGVDPDHAQFLETRTFQLDEVARWLNVPPHKLKNLLRSTNNNIEHQNLEYYIDCLSPWTVRWHQELEWKLIQPSERNQQSIEHVTTGLLRGDTAGRGTFYTQRFNTGSITPNAILGLENENPVEGGEQAFVPLNTIPLGLAKPYFEAEIGLKIANADAAKASAEASRRPLPAPVAPPDPNKQREIEILTEERDAARVKAQQAEDAMDIAKSDADALRVEWLETQKALQDETARVETSDGAYRYLTTESALREANLKTDIGIATELLSQSSRDLSLANTRAETVEIERDGLRADCATATAEIARLVSQGEALSLDIIDAQRTTAAAEHRTSTADAVIVELRAHVAMLEAGSVQLIDAAVQAKEALARVETVHAESVKQIEIERAETAEKLGELLSLQNRSIRTQAEIRGVLYDAVVRLVNRETTSARKASIGPDKLSKWVENFYPMHEHTCRAGLRPAVRAWLAATGNDTPVDRVLDRLIKAYVEESVRFINGVLIDSDQVSLAPKLEKVLSRWEADRAEATVDKLLREAA